MQIIFQDPYGSLNPRMTIGDIIGEGLTIHHRLSRTERDTRIKEALSDVGLNPNLITRFPHEFSGGQRQRIAIARAMIMQPAIVVLDEPTSALDRSVQVQIIDLLRKLQQQRQLTYIFISHDLKVIRAMAHRVLVMKQGKVVEMGDCDSIFTKPQEDYTKRLIAAADIGASV